MDKNFIELLKKFNFIIENHPFLTCANITSLILGLIPFLWVLITFELHTKPLGFIFLIPVFFVHIVSLGCLFLFKKIKIISRILSFLVNSFLILFVQIFVVFLVCCLVWTVDISAKCNNVKRYPMILKHFWEKGVNHFPREIPKSAKHVYLEGSPISFFGSEDIYLKFDIDKKYIEKELKKHSYIKIIPYKDIKWEDFHSFYCNNIDLNDFTMHIINDKAHYKEKEPHFLFHYGIAVNKNYDQILYYYVMPD